MNVDQLDANLRAWRRQHNTSAKVAAAHRKVLLERVCQSMVFESRALSIDVLKSLLEKISKRG
jgi:hypothetical protein